MDSDPTEASADRPARDTWERSTGEAGNGTSRSSARTGFNQKDRRDSTADGGVEHILSGLVTPHEERFPAGANGPLMSCFSADAPKAHEVDQVARRSLRALLRKERLRDSRSAPGDLPGGQRLVTRDRFDASFDLPVGRNRTRGGRGWKLREARDGDQSGDGAAAEGCPRRSHAHRSSRAPTRGVGWDDEAWRGRRLSWSAACRRSTARAIALTAFHCEPMWLLRHHLFLVRTRGELARCWLPPAVPVGLWPCRAG
jgi:hypothetical protein